MELLIKSATIVAPGSSFDGKVQDILIKDGAISSIGKGLKSDGQVIEAENLHVSPGWFDMRVNFRDPGHEYKEDLHSGLEAAAAGGFTGVLVMPSTHPAIHTKADIEYLLNKSTGHAVEVVPAGSLTHALEGEQMAEMYDMHQAGARAFTDDKQPVADPSLMTRALLYTQNFDGLTISYAMDEKLAHGGQMNEGEVSTMLGMQGIPGIAESLRVNREIELAKYTGAKLHFATISTARSVELIREAQQDGVAVTAEVAAHQLVLDDTHLDGFDSNYKVTPPLRGKEDIEALKAGLADGTIGVICSDHSPEDIENKQLEFGLAEFGISSVQTAFSCALEGSQLKLNDLVATMAINPRNILGLDVPTIEEGQRANLTLFNPDGEWTPGNDNWKSKSKNSPFMGKALKGTVIGICNDGKVVLN